MTYADYVADAFYSRGKYRYSPAPVGSNSKVKLKITCFKHGDFWQTKSNHLSRRAGCPACANEATGRRCRHGSEKIKGQLLRVLGPGFEVISAPTTTNEKAKIRCVTHNQIYEGRAADLMGGKVVGCRVCAGVSTREEVVSDAFLLSKGRFKIYGHDDKTLSKRFGGWCVKHGEFSALKPNLLSTRWGCPKCNAESAGRGNHENNGITVEQATIDMFYSLRGRYRILSAEKRGYDIWFRLLCPVHGEFTLSWKSYIKVCRGGFGCPSCGKRLALDTAANTRISGGTANFLAKVRAANPHLTVRSPYKGLNKLIKISCKEGHESWIPARRLIGSSGFSTHCEICHGEYRVSRPEIDLRDLLTALGVPYEVTVKRFTGRKELDIFVPHLNLGIEFNGTIWHSEKFAQHRLNTFLKFKECAEKGVRMVTICSSTPKKVAHNFIASLVGENKESYAARKCKIVVARSSHPDVSRLFEENHLQGNAKGCESYCLYHRGHIVAAMSFSSVKSRRGCRKDRSVWELRRFSSYGRVAGGASRLFCAFLRAHPECASIVSYSDSQYFSGGLYEVLGFRLDAELPPDYKYIKNGKKIEPKINFCRKKLATRPKFLFDPLKSERENCWDNGWYRLWDCGKRRWVFER